MRLYCLLFPLLVLMQFNSYSYSQGKTAPIINPKTEVSDTTIANKYFDKVMIFDDQAQYDSCLVYLNKACEIYEKKAMASDDPRMWVKYLEWMNGIGSALWRNNRNEKALVYLKKALATGTKIFGEYHPEVAKSYVSIGEILGRDKAMDY